MVAVLRGRVACRGACGDGGGCAGACVVVLHLMLRGVSFLRVVFEIKFGYKSTYNSTLISGLTKP